MWTRAYARSIVGLHVRVCTSNIGCVGAASATVNRRGTSRQARYVGEGGKNCEGPAREPTCSACTKESDYPCLIRRRFRKADARFQNHRLTRRTLTGRVVRNFSKDKGLPYRCGCEGRHSCRDRPKAVDLPKSPIDPKSQPMGNMPPTQQVQHSNMLHVLYLPGQYHMISRLRSLPC